MAMRPLQYQEIQPVAYLYRCIKCSLFTSQGKKKSFSLEESGPSNWLPSELINDADFSSVFCDEFNVNSCSFI